MVRRQMIDIATFIGNPNTLVTRKECANFLGVHEISWDRMVKRGDAPAKATKEGSHPMWRVGDVIDWAKNRHIRPTTQVRVNPKSEEALEELGKTIAAACVKFLKENYHL